MDVTTATERALLEQHGLVLASHDTNSDGARVEVWRVSVRVELVVSGAGAHFIIDGHDETTPACSLSVALAALQKARARMPDVYGSNLQ